MTTFRSDRLNWWLIGGFWLLLCVILAGKYLLQADTVPLHGDTDDAMRMVTAMDLWHGQPWQDLIEHRDNVPFGASMHWSRLVDAPIAVLMALVAPLVGAAAAPNLAAIIWPLLLLLPLLILAAAVTRVLLPTAGAVTALGLSALNIVLTIEFSPGRVDHHNVQILLTQATLLVLLTLRRRVSGGLIAGLLVATSLAIGMETLPLALAAIAAYALCWVADPTGHRKALIGFAASLALCTAAHFLLATEPSLYFVAACDALSITYVAAITLGALGLALAAIVASRLGLWPRLAVAVGFGIVAVGITAWLYPQCLTGPYAAVDPRVLSRMFSDIAEAQPLWQRLALTPAVAISFTFSILLAVPLTAWRACSIKGEQRANWLIVLGFLVAASLVMIFQFRGARLAASLALPAAAWVITTARQRYLAGTTAKTTAALIGSWLLFCTLPQYFLLAAGGTLVGQAHAAAGEPQVASQTCLLESSFAKLAALPVGRVAAPIGLSSHILRYTPHSVLSAGFHRNAQSIIDSLDFFAGGDEIRARQIVNERGLNYVVTCNAPGETGQIGPAPGTLWSWLTPLSAPDDVLQIYRIAQ
jgi:hypothetical protein